MTASPPLTLRLLGDLQLARGDTCLDLPRSKKTRALLAYLALTSRPHRRDRLTGLLWDIPDDPRGALRWSLSKLRPLVDDPDRQRIVADRETVAFDANGVAIDLLAARQCLADGPESATTESLLQAAEMFRGDLLEGLELPDQHEFQAWCVAEREAARNLHSRILPALVDRLADTPEAALRHARTLCRIEPYSEAARSQLVRLLAISGHSEEAEQQYGTGCRLLAEAGLESSGALRAARTATAPLTASSPPDTVGLDESPPETTLIGRAQERDQLLALLTAVAEQRREHVALLTGEPGLGKTRLLAELIVATHALGGTVLDGCAYEAEGGRPYGPWVDALRRLPAVAVGRTLGTDLALLLPELAQDATVQHSRDRLFGAVAELIAARVHSAAPVLLVLDDVQWCDTASAELLHYVARMNRHRPLLIALAARDGELPDNAAMLRVLRGLRRDNLLTELALDPLDATEARALARTVAPDIDAERVVAESAGNPLFVLEVARSLPHRRDDLPQTLTELVHDRVDRLPAEAADLLRWAAILGRGVPVRRLEALAAAESDTLVSALETLERHALLRPDRDSRTPGGAYAFTHDLVRQAVYAALSEPRRRMMHRRAAEALMSGDEIDEAVATDIVYHAGLPGEAHLAASACAAAGRRCLRLFANTQAEDLARRGMHFAEELDDPARVKLLLELTHVSQAAYRPAELDAAAEEVKALAERALDLGCLEHARLGFQMISYLHWEHGDWSDALANSMRAELVSRSSDDAERAEGMAEAAWCLAILERDLGQAEAMLLEAGALSHRTGVEPVAAPLTRGKLQAHQGAFDKAIESFREARTTARRDGNRMSEFIALEHLLLLALQQGAFGEARALSAELIDLGEKLRGGSEAPLAHAFAALARYAEGEAHAATDLEAALDALRAADAKHRLAIALTRCAEIDLRQGNLASALAHAREAVQVARVMARPSELIHAQVTLVRAAAAAGEDDVLRDQLDDLRGEPPRTISALSRSAWADLRAELGQTAEPRST